LKHTKYNNSVKGRYRELKRAAKNKGLGFNVSYLEYAQLLAADCAYCGSPDLGKTGSGVDRIDSNKGYKVANIKACCPTCNFMKHNLTETQFYKHILRIARHLKLL